MKKGEVWVSTYTDRAAYDDIKARAPHMRRNPTAAEKCLWQRLRKRQVLGFRFRRQHPINRFIVDFYCRGAGLVIEVDGSVHDSPEQAEYDRQRETFLEERGIQILRFTNTEVLHGTDMVIDTIARLLSQSQVTGAPKPSPH